MASTAFAFVIKSAAVAINDIPVSLVEGDAWVADDPVVNAYPAFFDDTPKVIKRSTPETPQVVKKTAAKKS